MGFQLQLLFVLLSLFALINFGHTGKDGSKNKKQGAISVQLGMTKEEFSCKLNIGKEKKPYNMILGTSFAGVWIFSKQACSKIKKGGRSFEMCKNVLKYDDTKLVDIKEKFTMKHLQGEVSGYIIKDTIKIGGKTLKDQDIGIVTSWSDTIATYNFNGNFDGFFGIQYLASDSETSIGHPLFKSLLDNHYITDEVYGIYLSTARENGELVLGGVNLDFVMKGEKFVEVPTIEGVAGWFVEIKSIKVGSQEVGTNIKALIDPSNNHIGGNKELIDKINNEIGATASSASPLFVFDPCSKTENLPKVTLNINGVDFTLEGYEYYWIFRYQIAAMEMCASHFYSHKLEGFDLILGSPFINKYYSKFDTKKKTVSFARAGHSD